MKKVHLIYPHGEAISAPNSIGRNLGERLSKIYEVIYHDIQESGFIKPGGDDVLLGHAWPTFSLFRRSCKKIGWARIILLQPYCHGDDKDAFVEGIIRHCDLFLAITGAYWFKEIRNSKFKHWLPKMRHLDLAVDRRYFPVIKNRFNPSGKRKFVYIGSNLDYKNVPYLSQISQALPEMEFFWIGKESKRLPGVTELGRMDFGTETAKKCISEYDFMLTVGKADGNPTTILEAMSWGLIPVCTPQSGYVEFNSIPNIPINQPEEAAVLLRELQFMEEQKLLKMQRDNWNLLDTHFNWERFTCDVISAIESKDSPACLPVLKKEHNSLLLKSFFHLRLDSWPLPRRIYRKSRNHIDKIFSS